MKCFTNAVREVGYRSISTDQQPVEVSFGWQSGGKRGRPKAVKYGVTRDYVLNMQVVLPTGEVNGQQPTCLRTQRATQLYAVDVRQRGHAGA